MADEKEQIMARINITDDEWEQFRELIKPMNAADALGQMVRFSLEAESTPFSKVVENLLRETFQSGKFGKKKGSPS
jgi:hypothetical protein